MVVDLLLHFMFRFNIESYVSKKALYDIWNYLILYIN